MNQFVDALGKACPMPVILAKKEIDAGNTSFVVAVDNEVAVENLKRLAESQNYQASVETKDGNFHVTFVGDGDSAAPAFPSLDRFPVLAALQSSVGPSLQYEGPAARETSKRGQTEHHQQGQAQGQRWQNEPQL